MKEVRYFFVPDAGNVTELPQEEAKHALKVLRLTSGDEINLMDGEGNFYRAEVSLASSKHCLYQILETFPQQPAWKGKVHLAIAPTKMMDRIEWMAEKATEIGFDELSFLFAKFSDVKQSHKAWKPVVNEMIPFKEFIAQPRTGKKYICHCYEEIDKVDLFAELQKPLDDEGDVTILVGPEGDFSIEEVQLALQHGYVSVSLGTSRLRTETAGLMAVAMANLARRI